MNLRPILLSVILAFIAGSAGAASLVFNGGFERIQGGVWGVSTADNLATSGNSGLWAPNWGSWTDSAAQGWDITPGALDLIFAPDGLSNEARYGDLNPGWSYGSSYLLYTDGLGVDPNGGNFVGLDGDEYGGVLSQRIDGLNVGSRYKLTFFQAMDHYQGWGDLQVSRFWVGFGGDGQLSPTMSTTRVAVPWQQVNMIFTAHSSSQLLTFMNAGAGAPPFALLDGVTLTEGVPEPSLWAVAILGFGLLGAVLRRRRARSAELR